MKTTNLAVYAGQRVHFNLTISPAGHEAPVGALVIPGAEPLAMEVSGDQLVTPELAPGLYLYEIRCQGVTVLSGHVNVYPSPLSEHPGTVTLSGTADISGPLVQCEVSLGETGPAGQQGETGPAPAHEWQGTSLRFKNPDNTWGDLVDLQGPQGESGTGGGVTIDARPTSGSSNAVSSGGVYDALKMMGSGYDSVAVGDDAKALSTSAIAVGKFANVSVEGGTAVGTNCHSSGYSATAVGIFASVSGEKSTAFGALAQSYASGAGVFGAGGYISDTGVTTLNAGGSMTDGKSTQLYLIPSGSTMASNYTNGRAGLGYVVLDHLSGSVVARGTIQLSSICTDHTSDFSPTNVTSISAY